jgi:diguanylate cyclase (GGDEF)-like protein
MQASSDQNPALPEQDDTSADTAGGKSLILIIDDNVPNIRLLATVLADKATILFATNGARGLQIAREKRPQLILLDLQMPDMNGYEVCRALKSDPVTQECVVIFVTGNTNSEAEVAGLEAGAVDYLTKPLNPPIVRARVQTQLTLKQHAEMLQQLASRDGLTGLYNRRYFDHQLNLEWRRHQRQELPLSLALIDVDHFKAYNDGYGHLEGDACLRQVAQVLAQCTRRPGEMVSRYGGEEFAVILPATAIEDGGRYGGWLCAQMRARQLPHAHSATAAHVTISVGVATVVPTPGVDANVLLSQADSALYKAKQLGRNQAAVYR